MKLDDVPFIVRDMKNEMPVHTPNTAQVPNSFIRGLPKNLMDRSAEVDNKFLNNHLHEIEEFYHCFPDYHSGAFELYQAKTYARKYDILNHDGFFNDEKIKDWYERIQKGEAVVKGSSLMIPSSYVTHPAAGGGCTEGSQLTTTDGATSQTGINAFIILGQVTGTIGQCYDQLDCKCSVAVDDVKQGWYDEQSGIATNLIVETGAIALTADWNNKVSITETSLTTANNWIGFQTSSGSGGIYRTASSTRITYSHTYANPWDDPSTTSTSSGSIYSSRLEHS